MMGRDGGYGGLFGGDDRWDYVTIKKNDLRSFVGLGDFARDLRFARVFRR